MRARAAAFGDRLLGSLVALVIRVLRRTDPDRAADFAAGVLRCAGPWLPAHRIGRANLKAAFPDRDDAWIERTLRGAWDNLGRVAAEYVHLGRLWDYDPENPNSGRIVTDDAERFLALRDDGLPALAFTAHLGNWELPAVAAVRHGLPSAAVYRLPNNRAVGAEIERIRRELMGRLIRSRPEAVFEMATALENGEHLGMLIDQHWSRGVDVTFFGRPCRANPTLARLARQFECPVVGVRVIRLPDRRFRVSLEGPFPLPRDAGGRVDVAALMQQMTSKVEEWIRQHPEQWLWFHRRWRPLSPRATRLGVSGGATAGSGPQRSPVATGDEEELETARWQPAPAATKSTNQLISPEDRTNVPACNLTNSFAYDQRRAGAGTATEPTVSAACIPAAVSATGVSSSGVSGANVSAAAPSPDARVSGTGRGLWSERRSARQSDWDR